MKLRGKVTAGVAGAVLLIASSAPTIAKADVSAPALVAPSGLAIAEMKIIGDEFVVLQNNTGAAITDLSSYWLYDFNNVSPLSAGVSSSQQQLPAVNLDKGQSLLLSTSPRNTCGAQIAGKLNISLTDGGGFLEIVRLTQATPASPIVQVAGDSVSWSSTTSGSIQKVPSSTTAAAAMYYRTAVTTQNPNGWQQADVDTPGVCQLQVTIGTTKQPAPMGSLVQPTDEPPAVVISLADDSSATPTTTSMGPSLPASDIGLVAPQITELLPNPNGTGNDGTDEFIELYNSNQTSFDLSGFVLQTGTTTKHSFTFPAGTSLPAKSFVSFYASDTGLSLSNTSGQANLLDPLGNQIGQTDTYATAKDGMAWALANGTWYWTTTVTPSASNVITQGGSAATVLGAKTSAAKSTKKTASTSSKIATKSVATTPASNNAATTTAQVTPIHPWTLAVVAALAVAYGLYEYRLDVANRLYQFRKHRAARGSNR